MARYPGEENERRFSEAALKTVLSGIFQGCGMGAPDAGLLADTLVQADLRGIHSHGVLRVPDYVKKLTVDGANPKGRPRVARDSGAGLRIDGDNAMGQIGASFAMSQAIERARDLNVAFAALGGSNHCGAMDYYALMAAREDMIGIAGTNALPTMAPWGGTDRTVGLNPLSVAIPTAQEPPFVFDFSLGATARGKIRIYGQKGLPIPDDWALDSEGRPTTDPQTALAGLVRPLGAYKGIALAMTVGILSSVLSGAGYGTESGNLEDGAVPGRDGQFFLAIKVAGFQDPDHFKRRIDGIMRRHRATTLASGFDRVYAPGDLEHEIELRNRKDGIPLNEEAIALILRAAEQVGADAGALREG